MRGWGEISLWEKTLHRPCLPLRRGLTGEISPHYDADIQRGLLSTPEALSGERAWKSSTGKRQEMKPEQTVHTNHGHTGRVRGNPGHDHDHDYRSAGRRSLIIVLILLCCHMGIEIAGGILSGSLGLLAHATHMITDAVAIGLALFAMWIAERPATITRTFGYHRTEVLAVMFNALALWVLASWIFYEAYQRLTDHAHGHSHEVEGVLMLAVASAGLAINMLAAWILYRSSRYNITRSRRLLAYRGRPDGLHRCGYIRCPDIDF